MALTSHEYKLCCQPTLCFSSLKRQKGDSSELLLHPDLATLPNTCDVDGMWANEQRRELALAVVTHLKCDLNFH